MSSPHFRVGDRVRIVIPPFYIGSYADHKPSYVAQIGGVGVVEAEADEDGDVRVSLGRTSVAGIPYGAYVNAGCLVAAELVVVEDV